MQWILQEFEDSLRLGQTLERMEIPHTFHKVVPFEGRLFPEPVIDDPAKVVLFGSYSMRNYAAQHNLTPGVFVLRPFLYETRWYDGDVLLNGAWWFGKIREFAEDEEFADEDFLESEWFFRPLHDSKEISGTVFTGKAMVDIARKVCALPKESLIGGSLSPDTEMFFASPKRILKEWRTWVVGGKVVTYSLYKEGSRVVYRNEIDADALAFAEEMAKRAPDYSPAYVMDICRVEGGSLKMIETNCINAAGLYASDIGKIVHAIENL